MSNKEIEKAKKFLQDTDAVLIITDINMDIDKNFPDFRSLKYFWDMFPITKELSLPFCGVASPKWFNTNSSIAWAYYGHKINIHRKAVPHHGFKMLLDLVKKKNNDYFIYTSSVYGAYQKAGFDKEKIVELNGNIHYLQCCENCKKEIWEADVEIIEIHMNKFEALNIPRCKYCGNIARPNIAMGIDSNLNREKIIQQKNKINKWAKSIRENDKKLAILEIDVDTTLLNIRHKGEDMAKEFKNHKIIRINSKNFQINKNIGFSIPFGGLEGLEKVL